MQTYTLFLDGKQIGIEPFGERWLAWLETISSFSFQSRSGASCTVRKEAVQRGSAYWYAYRRSNGRMLKRYLARTAEMTPARLEHVTLILNETQALSGSDLPASNGKHTQHIIKEALAEPNDESAPSQPLLQTRLHLPRLPMQYVSRPRLLALLQQGMQGRLTLVAAPAGSGKTMLLAEWVATAHCPVAWISLDTADNDPARFLSYLLTALASLDQRIDTVYQPTNAHHPEQALAGVLNDLSHFLEREAVVILDDYHLLTSDAVHQLLRFLLDHLPTHLHLMIGTRVDPPLPLARLRMQRQLSEIRTEDLRFAPDEVEALTTTMGLVLSHDAIDLLALHTEGWIAGIQLLTLVLHGQADASAYLHTFRGTHRFFLDYLSEEVLAQQTPETQRFLLYTSILAQMTGPLCDVVTQLSDGQARLAQLFRANLFVSVLDDAEIWYRYHALFAETLRTRLQKLEPDVVPELYLRASRWYEQQGRIEEACDYTLLAGDFPRAGALLTELLPQMIEQGYFEQLGRWLDQLPPALIANSPQLSIAMPWMSAFHQGSSDRMEQALKQMERHMQKQQQHISDSWVEPQSVLTLLHALTAISHNNFPHAFSLIGKALHALTQRETALSLLISRFLQISLSIMYGASGDLASAEQTLLDLSTLHHPTTPFSVIQLVALFLLGELYKAQGQLRKAETLYDYPGKILESHTKIPPIPLLVISYALLRKAALLYEWNRLEDASSTMQQVLQALPSAILEIIPPSRRSILLIFGHWAQARIEWAQGRTEAARAFFEMAQNQPEILQKPSEGEQAPINLSALAARLQLLCGQTEEAIRWQRTCGLHFDDIPETLQQGSSVFSYLTLARILIAQGRRNPADEALSQALTLLELWRHLAQRLDFQSWLIEIQMLTALTLQAQGHTRQALNMLGIALARAETEGYVRLFADEGQPMMHLLAHISPYATASPTYIQRIQSAIPSAHQALLNPPREQVSQMLPDPLSGREREVLALLAAGASNQQIADQLVISLNTAKRHVKHILAKLAAPNRLGAVIRARELHLL
jgi:LuxR family transcriptional regulator, maltose regulon positive regulatory protein